jgi:hypothetical protein
MDSIDHQYIKYDRYQKDGQPTLQRGQLAMTYDPFFNAQRKSKGLREALFAQSRLTAGLGNTTG